ncbi:hypothetical protein B0H10DRAFT_1293512 [Mycena sp. CBHHK59/15]|nr:hypothetical protein B0H10DRAFT_1293512 [Mycena sp. CBHHK59/15]
MIAIRGRGTHLLRRARRRSLALGGACGLHARLVLLLVKSSQVAEAEDARDDIERRLFVVDFLTGLSRPRSFFQLALSPPAAAFGFFAGLATVSVKKFGHQVSVLTRQAQRLRWPFVSRSRMAGLVALVSRRKAHPT